MLFPESTNFLCEFQFRENEFSFHQLADLRVELQHQLPREREVVLCSLCEFVSDRAKTANALKQRTRYTANALTQRTPEYGHFLVLYDKP